MPQSAPSDWHRARHIPASQYMALDDIMIMIMIMIILISRIFVKKLMNKKRRRVSPKQPYSLENSKEIIILGEFSGLSKASKRCLRDSGFAS